MNMWRMIKQMFSYEHLPFPKGITGPCLNGDHRGCDSPYHCECECHSGPSTDWK